MTPCERLGYRVGDKFEEVNPYLFDKWAELTLVEDDGTGQPRFSGKDGGVSEEYFLFLEEVIKIDPEFGNDTTNQFKVQAIVATSPTGCIGVGKDLIYHNKQDLAFFSGFTQGKACLVGHNTLETLPHLKGREVVKDTRHQIELLKGLVKGKQTVVIGGGKTYRKYAKQIEELCVTEFNLVHEKELTSSEKDLVYFNLKDFSHLDKKEVVMRTKDFFVVKYFS